MLPGFYFSVPRVRASLLWWRAGRGQKNFTAFFVSSSGADANVYKQKLWRYYWLPSLASRREGPMGYGGLFFVRDFSVYGALIAGRRAGSQLAEGQVLPSLFQLAARGRG